VLKAKDLHVIIFETEKTTGQEFKKTGSEIGKALAEKSRGLFSADDWMCKASVASHSQKS
jgi:hypothetical protein